MLRIVRRTICFALFVAVTFSASLALAVDPNPLESAYWRFEEGAAGSQVVPGQDNILDSINDNRMRADTGEAPFYTSNVPGKPLKSGEPNTLALDFFPNEAIFANNGENGQNITNGIIEPGGGFTVEAAFRTDDLNNFATIVGKGGRPGQPNDDFFLDRLPTFALKIFPDAVNPTLFVQQFDAAGNEVHLHSQQTLQADVWYYAAVVNDGSQLSLWLDSDLGDGYELQGSIPVDGALYQGGIIDADFNEDGVVDAADYVLWRKSGGTGQQYNAWRARFGDEDSEHHVDNWNHSWTIGRGQFGGGKADWFSGFIDEVRISNSALDPSEFLFAPPDPVEGSLVGTVPEPSSVVIAVLALAAVALSRGTGRRR